MRGVYAYSATKESAEQNLKTLLASGHITEADGAKVEPDIMEIYSGNRTVGTEQVGWKITFNPKQ